MYIKISNNQPEIYTVEQLRNDNPNTSFPAALPDHVLELYQVYPLTVLDLPAFNDKTEKVIDGEIYQDADNNWVKGYAVLQKTQEEIVQWIDNKSAEMRAMRNFLLSETDYLALSDTTLTADMAAYRQALRDITTQTGFPENIVWPIKP